VTDRTISEAELARTNRASAQQLADLEKTIVQNPTSTIVPESVRADSLGRAALKGLGMQTGARNIEGGLELDRTIGEGGMGIVRLATQRSLGRQVAVKTLRPNVKTEDATIRLLREAWVTGSLEHPNIVPVYDLGLDEGGSPVIVLKRIEGVEWATLIDDAHAVRERFGATDLLEYNLRILIQLCNAVSLAHARGILHRDLKPENVMIGSFGEVYLVDWGIALSLKEDPTGRLPLASAATEMAGTPAYMAPEMLGAMGKLCEQTDVYLLGAVLYEILTGAPPHRGGNFREICVSILLSNPDVPDGAPRELADIVKKAMSRDAAQRFATPEEMRKRLEWYLRHRGSLALSNEAMRRVTEMHELVARTEEDVRDRLYQIAAEARFGFRSALGACEDNDAARVGMRDAIETMVVYELERGTPEAASAALAELDSPPPELAKRVRDALATRDAEKKRVAALEKMGAQLDPMIGRRTRMGAATIVGAVWSGMPLVTGKMVERYPDFPRQHMYWWTGGVLLFGVAVVRWGRESLMKTAVNRRFISACMIMFASQFVLEIGANLAKIPTMMTAVLHLAVWFMALCMTSAFIEKKLWFSTAVMGAAFLYACAFPAHVWWAMSVSNAVLLVNFGLAWRDPSDRDYRRQRIRREVDAIQRRFR
jgi:eukaryotic-like serine/threonine-protein kinase